MGQLFVNRLRSAVVVSALTLVAADSLPGQSTQSLIDLNRAGRWEETVIAARRTIAEPTTTVLQRCETVAHLTYALGRLHRDTEAREQGHLFGRHCAFLPAGHWARAEVAGILAHLGSANTPAVRPVPSRDDDWPTGNPISLGLDTAVLRLHRDLCARSGADACIVVRDGVLVDEWYGHNYAEPVPAMSSTKSITGLLVGLLIADGKLSIDDPVSRWIPEWRAGAAAKVTVRHLLTMTSGLPDDRSTGDVGSVKDKEMFAFGRRLSARPGEKWAYTNNGVFILSPLIKRAAREPVADYANRRLFAPLGMRRTQMHVYPDGQAWTHAEMRTTPRDFARIGQMMLDRGRWRGRRVVPESWVEASTRKSQALADYGLLWWLDVPNGFAARGYLDTNLYVLPERKVVVVRMQSKPMAAAAGYEPEALGLFARMVK